MEYHEGKSLIESLGTESMAWGQTDIPTLLCPECGFHCNHFGSPKIIPGNDNYDANWGGRGDLLTIPIEGECGCNWEICFGFHKGSIAAYTQVIRSCKNLVDTFIYFIEAVGLSRIKIGFSKKPLDRLKQLQTGSPIELSAIPDIPSTSVNIGFEGISGIAGFKEGLATSVSNGGGAHLISQEQATEFLRAGKHFVPNKADGFVFKKTPSDFGLNLKCFTGKA